MSTYNVFIYISTVTFRKSFFCRCIILYLRNRLKFGLRKHTWLSWLSPSLTIHSCTPTTIHISRPVLFRNLILIHTGSITSYIPTEILHNETRNSISNNYNNSYFLTKHWLAKISDINSQRMITKANKITSPFNTPKILNYHTFFTNISSKQFNSLTQIQTKQHLNFRSKSTWTHKMDKALLFHKEKLQTINIANSYPIPLEIRRPKYDHNNIRLYLQTSCINARKRNSIN